MTGPPIVPADECSTEGDRLLDELQEELCSYVAFPSPEAAVAAALWIVATHAQPAWEHAPRLVASSPIKGCGKSRLMDCAEALTYRPMISANCSTAAIVRSMSDDDPITLLLDEADTIFGSRKAAENHEDVRGILNAGHARNRPYVRWDITTRSRETCPTFGMAMLACIGDLPDTIMDRAVVLRMRRRAASERVKSWRSKRSRPPLLELRERLHEWARAHLDELAEAEPDMPVEDRAADTFEPLVAIADLAGGTWPARARRAAVLLNRKDPEDGEASERLLADIRAVFGDDERLTTTMLLERLHGIDEAPWGDWYGKPLSAHGLARLLKPWGVRSKNVRLSTGQAKGYERDAFEDPWSRYLPVSRTPAVPSVPPSQSDESAGEPGDVSRDGPKAEMRPAPEQGESPLWDGGTDDTEHVRTDGHAPG